MSGIDQSVLDKLLNDTLSGTYAVYAQILQLFLNETPKSMKELKEKHAQDDCQSVIHISHTLKGNGLSIGAKEFSALCAQVENSSRQEKLDGLAEVIEQIEEEFQKCKEHLEKELTSAMSRSA